MIEPSMKENNNVDSPPPPLIFPTIGIRFDPSGSSLTTGR